MKSIKTLIIAISISSAMALPALALATTSALAATPSSSGACHGAFADTNGNFGWLGTDGGAARIGGGVPAGAGAAGYDNSAVSGDCTLPN